MECGQLGPHAPVSLNATHICLKILFGSPTPAPRVLALVTRQGGEGELV